MAYGSLFHFIVEFLGYSKGAAARRMKAARLLGRYPVIERYLADDRLNLTTLCKLYPVLRDGGRA